MYSLHQASHDVQMQVHWIKFEQASLSLNALGAHRCIPWSDKMAQQDGKQLMKCCLADFLPIVSFPMGGIDNQGTSI